VDTNPAAVAVFASPRRREIIRLVWAGEMEAGDIHRAMPDVTFGAISQHLRGLTDAGLLALRCRGRYRLYRANRDAFGPLGRMLEGMWSDALWRLKLQAELLDARRGPRPGIARRKTAGRQRVTKKREHPS
jgi:DNA-binding transcriptional ArsR family regulator